MRNNEHNEFARWRFPQRTSDSKAREAYAIEHYKPKRESRISLETWFAVAIGAAILAAIFTPPGV